MGGQKWQRWLSAALLVTMTLTLGTASVLADPSYYEKSRVTVGSTSNPGNVLWSKYNLYDNTPAVRPINDGKSFDDSIKDLLDNLNPGEVGAVKDGYFASEDDARNGIVKLVFDVVGMPPTEAVDVLVVLDESGSMTMYTDKTDQYRHAVPCMNENHFYKISYYLKANPGNLLYYNLYPNDFQHVNVWTDTAFRTEVKAEMSTKIGYPVDAFTLYGWDGGFDFGDHHYKNDSGAESKIPKSGGFDSSHIPKDSSGNPIDMGPGEYYSPPDNNSAGCIDRQMVAKQSIKTMLKEVTDSNGTSRFGLVTFAGKLGHVSTLSSSKTIDALDYRNGYDDTNYIAALSKAYEIVRATVNGDPAGDTLLDKPDGRETIVIFITDGMPTGGQEAQAIEYAKRIKNDVKDATLYCIGINTNADALLKQMASPGCFMDCSTKKQLEAFLGNITTAVSGKAAMMIDFLGDAYNLICDDAHPITMQIGKSGTPVTYNNLPAAEAVGIHYDWNTSKLQWNIANADAHGARLSVFVKLDEALYLSDQPASTGSYPTNKAKDSKVTYPKVDPNDPGKPGVNTEIPLGNPATLKIEQSKLTAVKTSDKPNKVVLPGDMITYTIAVTNTGKFPYTNVRVSDKIPDETEYISGSGGTLESDRVVFDIPSIAANDSESVSFQVRVLPGTKNIVNYAKFGTRDVAASISGDAPVCYANQVVNPRPGGSGGGGGVDGNIPMTGDTSHLALWTALFMLSAGAKIGLTAIKKRQCAGGRS